MLAMNAVIAEKAVKPLLQMSCMHNFVQRIIAKPCATPATVCTVSVVCRTLCAVILECKTVCTVVVGHRIVCTVIVTYRTVYTVIVVYRTV